MSAKKAGKILTGVLLGFAVMVNVVNAGFSAAAQGTASAADSSGQRDVFWSADSETIILSGSTFYKKFPVPELNPQIGFYTIPENQSFGGYCSETNTAAVLEAGQRLVLYDAGTAVLKQAIPLDFVAQGSACSPDGRTILLSSADELTAFLYDSETGEQIQTLSGYSTAAPVYGASFSPDGENILWHSRGTFQLQRIADGTLSETISLWDFVDVFALSPDSKILAALIPDEDALQYIVVFYDTAAAAELGRIALGNRPVKSIAFDPEGTFVILADQTGLSRVDLPGYQTVWSETILEDKSGDDGTADSIRKISFSPNGKFLAVLTDTEKVTLVRFKNDG